MPWEEERKVSLIHLSTILYTPPPALERERRRTSPPPPHSLLLLSFPLFPTDLNQPESPKKAD